MLFAVILLSVTVVWTTQLITQIGIKRLRVTIFIGLIVFIAWIISCS